MVDAPNCFCAGEGVPNETDRGDSCLDGVRRGDGRLLPDGDALYRGGVIASMIVVAIGVISAQD